MFGLDPSAEEREVSALPRLGRTARLMVGAGAVAVRWSGSARASGGPSHPNRP